MLGQYEYDYAKRRIARKTGDYQVWNVYAGSGLLNEYATAYVGTNVLTSRNDVTWGENEAIQTTWRGYQFTDALGSVTQTSTGAQIEYDAFGGIKTRSDAPDAQADTLTKIAASRVGYTGQFFDTETGLQPLGNGERYYNPKIGRFIQADRVFGHPERRFPAAFVRRGGDEEGR